MICEQPICNDNLFTFFNYFLEDFDLRSPRSDTWCCTGCLSLVV